MRKILQVGRSDVLRLKAKNVPVKEITGSRIKKIIRDMKDSLALQEDGVALAAPQIGIALRMFVVSGKTFAIIKNKDEKTHEYEDEVFINPKILKKSRRKEWMEEGCLSVRGKYGMVERAKKTTVEAYDEKGKKVVRGGSGLLSQIFQHETDHLDGILFIDKAREIKEIK